MADIDKFIQEMSEFKGMAGQALDSICKDIKKMNSEGEKHSIRFWKEMNEITKLIKQETIERINEDNSLNTEIQVMKGKASIISFVVAFFTSVIAAIWGWWRSGH